MSKYKFDWSKTKTQIKEAKTQKKEYGDSRIWKLKLDENKKGSAIIRFLPDKSGVPYVRFFSHWFRYESGSGEKVFAENCPTSIEQECPVCEKNRDLWNSAFDVDKNVARQRKRKQHYMANIYIIKDPANPENEGKTMLYDFGPQVFAKFDEAMYGPEDDDGDGLDDDYKTFMPCAFTHEKDDDGNDICGADFLLKATKKKGSDWVTYEYSKFKDQSEFLDGDEDEIDAVMDKTVDLKEWTDPSKYPDAQSVRNRLASILGVKSQPEPEVEETALDDLEDDSVEANTEEMSDDDYINSLI